MNRNKYSLALGSAALLVFAAGASTRAQTRDAQTQSQHVVSPDELNQDAARAAQSRQANEGAVRDLLKTSEGQEALRRAKVDYQRVDKAMAQVSDEDMAKLGERSRQAKSDFAAGAIGSTLLIVVILIIVLAIVLAVVF
jgi:Flp pilus assembly protein TadB